VFLGRRVWQAICKKKVKGKKMAKKAWPKQQKQAANWGMGENS